MSIKFSRNGYKVMKQEEISEIDLATLAAISEVFASIVEEFGMEWAEEKLIEAAAESKTDTKATPKSKITDQQKHACQAVFGKDFPACATPSEIEKSQAKFDKAMQTAREKLQNGGEVKPIVKEDIMKSFAYVPDASKETELSKAIGKMFRGGMA